MDSHTTALCRFVGDNYVRATRKKVAETLLAYLAGFVDGEGCIRIVVRRQKYNSYGILKVCWYHVLHVEVSNNDIRPLRILRRVFGGNIYKRKEKYRGKLTLGCKWMATSRTAGEALARLLPYLVVRKRRAELAVEFMNGIVPHGKAPIAKKEIARRERIRQSISKLTAKFNSHGPTTRLRKLAELHP